MRGLEGRVAVVTGGGRGIGAAVCRRLAEEGAAVAVLDLDPEPAAQVARTLPGAGAYAADAGDRAEVEDVVRRVLARHGRIDVLVPCAGVMRGAPVTEMTDQNWTEVLTSHLTGAFTAVRAVTPAMTAQGYGRIVLISSIAARGIAGHVNYGTAKAGIAGMARSLALELGPRGVTVNAVAPGFIATRMTREGAERRGRTWEEHAAQAAAGTTLRRIGTPEDVAAVVAFLAGADAGYVTGQVIHVSGDP
ncbi:SDR family NAD(P)-dependent oxidoreductase [Acrocarpospora pleiomorpha]|uniref:SDR family NAD(P)-dependent oxidoreductase n=1 Tax=Acrocarpospora pleiomorpha TaxID=90975 RepID=UPI0012D3441F|nr:SDR family NAD(P)-dependent oxidoreductase [Acrocarpospora pleiomorpha]